MSELIDHLELDGRFMRSIALDRDLTDPRALDSYLITPAAISVLELVGETFAQKRPQRAWKIVGPYGSGKSALGLLIAHLMQAGVHDSILPRLARVAPITALHFDAESNRLPLAIVGSRSSIGEALAREILKVSERWSKTRPVTTLRKRIDLAAGQYDGLSFSANVTALLQDFIGAALSQGYTGVLLLIDELGKFVEHAALRPEEGDLMALQRVAELACRPEDDTLAVITMLHQHFSEYARGVGRSLEDEWHKVAARFEEIAFDEPIERYALFAAHALGVKPTILEHTAIRERAVALYEQAQQKQLLRFNSKTDAEILAKPYCLYPLHPLTVAAMAVVSKRYGQSERSFHAFLRGHEPFGLRGFASSSLVDASSWLGLPEVFEFLASGHSLRFRDLAMERRWTFARTVADQVESTHAADMAVFKTIAVLELAQSTLRQPISLPLLQFALGYAFDASVIGQALERLVDRELLLHRRKTNEYALAVSEAVNIEAVYEQAADKPEAELLVLGLHRLTSSHPVIASRHYDKTGVIRTLSAVIATPDAWPQRKQPLENELRPDGELHVILADQAVSAQQPLVAQKVAQVSDPLVLTCLLPLSKDAKQALVEYSTWCLVQELVNTRRLDPWTNRYVDVRLGASREKVQQKVLSELLFPVGQSGPGFHHCGKLVPDGERMNLSRVASWLFDQVFPRSPKIVNELINKDNPSPAIVLGRQKLFEKLIAGNFDAPLFKDNEFPPERLIASTLLLNTGLLTEAKDGAWQVHEPKAGAKTDIRQVWIAIGDVLSSSERPNFQQVLTALAQPPLGLRAGPAGVWIVMYLLTRRRSCAVFERNTFVLELTAEHLARMFRNPKQFELRELPVGNESTALLHDYRNALAAVGFEPYGALSYIEIARTMIRWVSRLSEYSAGTVAISPDAKLVRTSVLRATDPIRLLTVELPEHFGPSKTKDISFEKWLTDVLVEISLTQRRLQDDVIRALTEGFSLSGGLKQIRAQLQHDCAEAVTDLAEAKLKSFILRCTNLTLTDEKWLDSVAGLLVERPLDTWRDETLPRFKQSLLELCGHYKRWIKLVRQSGTNKRAGERFLEVTMTLPSGEETSVFVAASDEAKQMAKSVAASVMQEAAGNRGQAIAALAQALTELQQAVGNEKDAAGERKAG
ncbi:hypothetical protein [Jeongeupia sp. USM3]|uniref:hypothetical protein n=1 Tax=Jeongeupia sp. USM3 TaxID=1906741 RepID=UPI00089DFDDA|nr:hypothetical protein [Jeongeupia sp. USM3]AOY00921.1 hypothetical protein BJP62_11000 [Jeongeupia sp. USM3]